MVKPKFIEKRVLSEIRKSFPNAEIMSYTKFKEGLVSPTYKVKIKNPSMLLVVKIYKAKNKKRIDLNNKIINHLKEKGFPVPKIYSNTCLVHQGIVVMEYIDGKSALNVYNNSSLKLKRKILINAGKLSRELHNIKVPNFWIHYKHEVNDKKEWIAWTKLRIKKYLDFAQKNLDKKHYLFLKKEFEEFIKLLNKNIKFVPIHWDYHLSNIIVNEKGEIVGLFDFDNAMKGHNLAEIGQTKYWLRLNSNDYENFKYFLEGYGKITDKDKILIKDYFLLHLLAVTRTVWKIKRLAWLIKIHKKILNEVMHGIT